MTGLSHRDDEYQTPNWLYDDLESWTRLGFILDAAANNDNKRCLEYLSDGLEMPWLVNGCEVPVFCNPPRSKNGKFVNRALEQWETHNIDIVMLLCWNDFGNKYGEVLFEHVLNKRILVKNYGKVTFYKPGKVDNFPSRLTYFAAWFKKRNNI